MLLLNQHRLWGAHTSPSTKGTLCNVSRAIRLVLCLDGTCVLSGSTFEKNMLVSFSHSGNLTLAKNTNDMI